MTARRLRSSNTSNASSSHSEEAHYAALELEMEQQLQETQQEAQDLTSQHTKNAYGPKIKEFKKWCHAKRFRPQTIEQVTGLKLHAFLLEKVLGRPVRSRGRKRRLPEAEVDDVDEIDEMDEMDEMDRTPEEIAGDVEAAKSIGFSTIDQYVSAITRLYNEQLDLNVNSAANHPRIQAVKNLLKNARKKETRKRRDNFEDRASGTMFDGYSTIAELTQIIDYFIAKDSSEHYRNAAMMLVSHFTLMRGENVRELELPDVQTLPLEREGPTPDIECPALVLLLDHGKTNQFGYAQHGSFIRNANVQVCPWMGLGLYLFYRWHIEFEDFPDMTSPQTWYTIKLFKTKPPQPNTKEITPVAHYRALDTAFKAVGIRSRAKTHAGRKSGAKMADVGEAGDSQIRRAGRWTNDSMEGSYLTNLPRRLLRVLADFPAERGRFYLQRAAVKPSPELCRKVFPKVEEWQAQIDANQGDNSIAADGFLKMLRVLRETLLQDSVLMQERFPQLSIWNHPLFSIDSDYLNFKRNLTNAMASRPAPAELTLQMAMPLMHDYVRTIHTDLSAQLRVLTEAVNQQSQSTTQYLEDLISGRVPLNVQVRVQPSTGSPNFEIAPTSSSSTSIPMSTSVAMPTEQSANSQPPYYRMSRGTRTVHELWREWHQGFSGSPACVELERRWGDKWRKDDRFSRRRKAIIDGIIQYANNHHLREVAVAVDRVEEIRKALGGKSLDWMAKNRAWIDEE